MKRGYTIEEGAKYIGCGKTKMYEYINSGRLKAKKLGRRTILLDEDLKEFLENLTDYKRA